jgi:hypothetical protein
MPLATTAEVATRMGRALTAAEQATAAQLLATLDAIVVEEAGKTLDWLEDLEEVPLQLQQLAIEKVKALLENPQGLAAESKGLGQYTRSRTYRRQGDGGGELWLTPAEGSLVRRVVWGQGAPASSTPRSLIDRVTELATSTEEID